MSVLNLKNTLLVGKNNMNNLKKKSKELLKKVPKKMSKKEYAELWKLADNEIKEWIKFKCILFADYNGKK